MATIEQLITSITLSQSEPEIESLVLSSFDSDLIYGYQEIRTLEKVKTLCNVRLRKTLELFAFGTVALYGKYRENVCELTESQYTKLQILSLLTAINNGVYDIKQLCGELSLTHEYELHKLVMQCNSRKLLTCKIDNSNNCVVDISHCLSRDVYLGDELVLLGEEEVACNITNLFDKLNGWYETNFKQTSRSIGETEVLLAGNNTKKRKQEDN